MNGITAFIDASNVYGSDKETADKLRSFQRGQLKVRASAFNKALLPRFFDDEANNHLATCGDVRCREMNGLAAMHTLFLREHNRIAFELAKRRPDWNDEKLYQHARHIVAAEMQNIVYGQYLPAVLGQATATAFGLTIEPGRTNYDPSVDPSIRNAFATASYRFGHSMIQGLIRLRSLTHRHVTVKQFQLRDNFFDLTESEAKGGFGLEEILAGLIVEPTQQNDIFVQDVSAIVTERV